MFNFLKKKVKKGRADNEYEKFTHYTVDLTKRDYDFSGIARDYTFNGNSINGTLSIKGEDLTTEQTDALKIAHGKILKANEFRWFGIKCTSETTTLAINLLLQVEAPEKKNFDVTFSVDFPGFLQLSEDDFGLVCDKATDLVTLYIGQPDTLEESQLADHLADLIRANVQNITNRELSVEVYHGELMNGSPEKVLECNRGGSWTTYYGAYDEAFKEFAIVDRREPKVELTDTKYGSDRYVIGLSNNTHF